MKYYQAETHCHTREVSPCSRIPAKFLVQEYAELDYKYLFITDHYHPHSLETPSMENKSWDEVVDHFLSGYKAARKAAEGTDVTVLLGMETALGIDEETGLGSDFLVFGFDEAFLREHPYIYRNTYKDFYELMHGKGYLVFQAHPYRYNLRPIEPVCYDGVEIVNAHASHFSQNQRAIQFAMEHNLYMIGGSDTHSDADAGRGGVLLPSGIETPMDFVDFYKENGSPELIVTFGA